MAESPLDRLKRLAAEKKLAAAAQPVPNVLKTMDNLVKAVAELSEVSTKITEALSDGQASEPESIPDLQGCAENASAGGETLDGAGLHIASGAGTVQTTQLTVSVEPSSSSIVNAQPTPTSNLSTHPLAMQFAELEAALLAQQPEFKTILRQIHRHLGQEPELVTQMTEQEIQLIVSGLVVFANAEIVAPAAAKTTKAKITAAKKVPISADDL